MNISINTEKISSEKRRKKNKNMKLETPAGIKMSKETNTSDAYFPYYSCI